MEGTNTTAMGEPGTGAPVGQLTTSDVGSEGFAPPGGIPFHDEGLRTHQGLAKFRDVDSLGKSYVELEKKIGERPSGVKPLTAESTPEEINAYRQAMGVPEKPDGYDLGELDFPEDVTPSSESLGHWRQVFHGLHLTPGQVQGIMQAYAEETSHSYNAEQERREGMNRATMTALTKEYGADAPKLALMAHEYVKRRFGQEGLDGLNFEAGGVGSSPIMIKLLIESARLTGHDKFIIPDGGGGLMDGETAQAKYNELAAQFYRSHDEAEKVRLKAEMERLAVRAHANPR